MPDAIVKRSGKVAFMLTAENTYKRMRGFTELSKSLNATEYSRQYVDEDTERTDVTGYAASIAFNMDNFKNDDVHNKVIQIFDDELIGADAVVSILVVDFSATPTSGAYPAYKRDYAVIPSTEGDTTEAYTYSGDFKANGEVTKGTATSADSWQTATFTAATDTD